MARSSRHANRLVGCWRAVKACNTVAIATVLHQWMGGLTWGTGERIVYYTTAGTVPALGVILVEKRRGLCQKRSRFAQGGRCCYAIPAAQKLC